MAEAVYELTQDAVLRGRLAEHAAEMLKQTFQPWKVVSERLEAYGTAIKNRKEKVIIAPGITEMLDAFNECKSSRFYHFKKLLRKIRMKF